MEVKQIASLVNQVTNEVTGKENLVAEDLSNVVDAGKEVFGAASVDNYVKSLVNHIGKVLFVDRPYTGNAPSVLMDGWEFGSVLEKIQADLPTATENSEWDLTDGQVYEQDTFHAPKVSAKFFNSRVTFEIPMSFTERQVKDSFSSAAQLNGFTSMLFNSVEKSMSIKLDSLIQRTINSMVAATIDADYPDKDYTAKSGVKAVNLLHGFNALGGQSLTAEKAITNPEFIRYAAFQMGRYKDRLTKISNLFNIGGKDRFTPENALHVVLLSDFVASATAYLQADTFNASMVALPKAERVPYWQGSGQTYAFSDVSKINATYETGKTVEAGGILGVMFDRDALGVSNLERRVTTHYNAKAEFYNNFFKFEAGYFNDRNENFIVFFVA